jgi:hypothetical protein
MYEHKKVVQPVAIKALDLDQGKFEVINKNYFTSLSQVKGIWSLTVDGEVIDQGELPILETPPQSGTTVTIPVHLCRSFRRGRGLADGALFVAA